MILIGENIHIISKTVREALAGKDLNHVNGLLDIQKNMDCIDLNVGPAKGDLEGVLPWLAKLSDKALSFDTTNAQEMKSGLIAVKNPQECFINSTSKDEPRMDKMTDLAVQFGSNIIALTLSKDTGIPKTADGRMEIAFEIYEKCLEKGIESSKIFFDPLILPLTVDQSQAVEALNTIKVIKESFDPPVKTVVGLSNISNGAPAQMRPLVNRVFGVLAFGAGLDAVIMDAADMELVRIFRMLEKGSSDKPIDNLYLALANSADNFYPLDSIEYDKRSCEELNVIKTAEVLLNKKIYSHSFTQV